MADEGASSIADSNHSPEPEKTGAAPESQKAGPPRITVLPAVRSDDKSVGLQESHVSHVISALLNQSGQQLAELAQVVGAHVDRQLDRAHEAIDKLQEGLRDEKVAHARTEERLKAVLGKDRTGALLNVIGGAVLGYGLNDLDHTPGKVLCAIGVVLLVISSWPLLPWSKD